MSTRSVVAIILVLSAAVIGGLFWLIYGFEAPGVDASRYSFLPASNALCNAVSATCVALGIVAIRHRRTRLHGSLMAAATLASALFLIGYIVHHTVHGDTRFLGEGWLRVSYLLILASHVILSMAVVPMVLCTLAFAALQRWSLHRRLARWTYPVWLYVSITGVLVFFYLRVLNPVG